MKHPLTLTLSILTILTFILQCISEQFGVGSGSVTASLPFTYYPDAPLPNFLLYHFFHVNIFHLLANLLALWYFKPRPTTILVSYIIATLCAYIDTLIIPTTTCGLSAFLFAAFARRYVAWKENIWKMVAIVLLTGIIPTLNWHIHLLSFIMSYVVWLIIYHLRSYNSH